MSPTSHLRVFFHARTPGGGLQSQGGPCLVLRWETSVEIAGLTLVNRGASRVHDVFFPPEDTFSTRGHTSHDGI